MEFISKAAIQEWLRYNGEALMIRLGLYKETPDGLFPTLLAIRGVFIKNEHT